jgi:hypothetical protein
MREATSVRWLCYIGKAIGKAIGKGQQSTARNLC